MSKGKDRLEGNCHHLLKRAHPSSPWTSQSNPPSFRLRPVGPYRTMGSSGWPLECSVLGQWKTVGYSPVEWERTARPVSLDLLPLTDPISIHV